MVRACLLFLELERDNVLMLLRKSPMVEKDPYDEESIFEESEMMNVGVASDASGNGNETRKVSSHLDSKGFKPFLFRVFHKSLWGV